MILQFADISKLLHKIYSFGFPVFTFFILGTRKGLPWNIAYFICLIVIFSNPGEYLRLYPYPMEGAARFCIVFVLIIMLNFTHEKVRERTQNSLEQEKDKLDTLNIKLHAASRAAERANRAKSAFLANMSHEIRPP
jgi:signal transduction histidine kinase